MIAFGRFMQSFARACDIKDEQGVTLKSTRAFISPLRYKNKLYLYGVNTQIGYNPEGCYLYIGPGDADITPPGSIILCGGEEYRTERGEKVYKGDSVFYIWAILRKTVEEEEI